MEITNEIHRRKMRKFKLIIKGIMLWITAFVTILFISGVDSIYDNGYFFQTLIAVAVMIFCCYKLISEEEFKKVTFYNLLKLDEDE